MTDDIRGKTSGKLNDKSLVRHIFIIGAKSIGHYGGYETFVDRLIGEHENEPSIKYHIACKANGDGFMDENQLDGVSNRIVDSKGNVVEFIYKNAHVFKIPCPNIGPAVAIYYDRAAVLYSINYCKKYRIEQPIFYILTCRIGLFIDGLAKNIKSIGGRYYLNPDGHEWMRAKWSRLIRKYWKWSEKRMVGLADLVICDSMNIEKYIKNTYQHSYTTYIAYGADLIPSKLADDDERFISWLNKNNLTKNNYYLVVGRFVPENNYETIIREFMNSKTDRMLAIITNVNERFLGELEKKLHWKADARIRFVGPLYDKELLKKIRESAYAYFHGHEVGGTNPSLLEAMGSTDLNLLLNVGFNREVGEDSTIYWEKEEGQLADLINRVDRISAEERDRYGMAAKNRVKNAFSWKYIGDKYKKVWDYGLLNEIIDGGIR